MMKSISFMLCFLLWSLSIQGQIHTFSTFDPGQVSSANSGISTNLTVSGLSGDYLFYKINMDFDTDAIAALDVAWSNSIRAELNNNGVIYTTETTAIGAKGDPSTTTLYWTGILMKSYTGGDDLTFRVYDSYHDSNGPYFSNISNVQITLYGVENGGDPVTISGGGATMVSGMHPSFTITSTDTKLTEVQVDAFANNNGYLTAHLWNQTSNDVYYNAGKVGIGLSNPAYQLQVGGDVDILGELTAASDIRLKKNIQPLSHALDILQSLNPVSYDFRTEEFPDLGLADRRKMGLIAQEVESILPNLVSESNMSISTADGPMEIKSVNYMEMVPLLIQSIKELKNDLDQKNTRILELENEIQRVNRLEDELAKLRKRLAGQ